MFEKVSNTQRRKGGGGGVLKTLGRDGCPRAAVRRRAREMEARLLDCKDLRLVGRRLLEVVVFVALLAPIHGAGENEDGGADDADDADGNGAKTVCGVRDALSGLNR
jgi:hypothetical protein